MKRHFLLLCLFFGALGSVGCHRSSVPTDAFPAAPDYAQSAAWFEGGGTTDKAYDVFYVVPTCVFDWTMASGDTCHYMDTRNPDHQARVNSPIRLARGIFADEANFFAPYYRQITLESWMQESATIEHRFATAYADIEAAFRYYLEHLNGGRPFVLAGHSQGGKAVIELLVRAMDDTLYKRMIAAYALGYPVRDTTRSPYLHAATDATGNGVVVSFSTVSDPNSLKELLSGSQVTVNPLNWTATAQEADTDLHLGSIFADADGHITEEKAHWLSARVDTAAHALVVTGADPMAYYLPELAALFPPGNFHVVELNFFYRNLQQNVRDRAAAYFQRTSSVTTAVP